MFGAQKKGPTNHESPLLQKSTYKISQILYSVKYEVLNEWIH